MASDSREAPNLEQLMQFGIQAARLGNHVNARVIFQQVLDSDTKNERAWLWMAAVAETPEDRVRYLNTVLQINPANRAALRELDRIHRKSQFRNSEAFRYGLLALGLVIGVIIVAVVLIVAL
jgi:hypothetical protein